MFSSSFSPKLSNTVLKSMVLGGTNQFDANKVRWLQWQLCLPGVFDNLACSEKKENIILGVNLRLYLYNLKTILRTMRELYKTSCTYFASILVVLLISFVIEYTCSCVHCNVHFLYFACTEETKALVESVYLLFYYYKRSGMSIFAENIWTHDL